MPASTTRCSRRTRSSCGSTDWQPGAGKRAIAVAEAGGIAGDRKVDSALGPTIRGFTREKQCRQVIGLRRMREEWGRQHGLRPEWIQPEKRLKVAHYDVFGPGAEALIARLKPDS